MESAPQRPLPSLEDQRRRLQQLMDSPARTPGVRSRVYGAPPLSPLAAPPPPRYGGGGSPSPA